ncbi:MAG TPA: oligosaccharide flippase family protein, partial [Blastocatellia bacterium]|nr:oligosaccharide flippase family protein [Blastocatellia bacterium]
MLADPEAKTLIDEQVTAITDDRAVPPAIGTRFGSALPGRLGQTTRQTSMLFSAQGGGMFFGLLASLILGRWMPTAEMGRFAFCLTVVVVSSVFFEFGVSSAGARVLALAKDVDSERQALGALVVMTAVISMLFAVFIAIAATPLDWFFQKDVRWLLIATAALSVFQPFQLFIEQGCKGLNRIRQLSVFQVLMSGVYVAGLAVMALAHRLTAGAALGAYFIGMGAAVIWTLVELQPSFTAVRHYVKLAIIETKSFGLNMYVARISGMASSRSDQLAIAYFVTDPTPLGIYALVQKFSNPIAMLGSSLATTQFRTFASLNSVPRKILRWNAAILISASVALVVFGPIVLRLFFPKYAGAAP